MVAGPPRHSLVRRGSFQARLARRFPGGIALGLLVALGCACSAGPPLRDDPAGPPTVSLPLERAGIADQRPAFAAWFGDELARDPVFGGTAPPQWLHGPPPVVDPEAAVATNPAVTTRRARTAVLIVPGLFGDCLGPYSIPFGDGVPRPGPVDDGAAYSRFADLGFASIRKVPLPGRSSSAANGAVLATAIRTAADDEGIDAIILVAYSKGVADALQALAELASDDRRGAPVVALVSVAGTVLGTPIADRFEGLYRLVGARIRPLDCGASDGQEIASVTRAQRTAWLAANPPPADIAYYSIVAHTAPARMAPGLRTSARWLEPIDARNDGQVLAADAILPGGALLAEARTDHWGVALPRDADDRWLARTLGSAAPYPRDVLLRATLRWVDAQRGLPPASGGPQQDQRR